MTRRRSGSRDSRDYDDWLDFSYDDLQAAITLMQNPECRNAAAFHCQQCIEKALKAFILYKTGKAVDGHNLTWLCKQAVKQDTSLDEWLDESAYLNRYYIQTRYPSDEPLALDEGKLQTVLKMAKDMYAAICERVDG